MELNDTIIKELKKICKISSDNAADSLSRMINKQVKINFPNLSLKPMEEINQLDENTILSFCEIQGDFKGTILMAFMKDKCLSLVDLLMFQEIGTIKDLNEDVKGAFNEFTNIIGGSYLSSLANYLQFKLFPLPPQFIKNATTIKENLPENIREKTNGLIFIKTELYIETTNIEGSLLLILDDDSLNDMLTILNK